MKFQCLTRWKWDEGSNYVFVLNKITRADGYHHCPPETTTIRSLLLLNLFLNGYPSRCIPFENKPVMIVCASYYDQRDFRVHRFTSVRSSMPQVSMLILTSGKWIPSWKSKRSFRQRGSNIINEEPSNSLKPAWIILWNTLRLYLNWKTKTNWTRRLGL